MNLEQLTKQTIEAAKEAGSFIRGEKDKLTSDNIETKGLHDHVTYVDKTAEAMLVDSLSKILPEAGFIVEEETSDKKGDEYDWIVDPLDGTSNFIHGFGPFAVSIALIQNRQKIVLGVVYEVMGNEAFYAWEGSKAYCNDKEISVSSTNDLTHAMIATGFPYNEFDRLDQHVKTLSHFLRTSRGMRRMGSAATDICYVACGRFDAFWEYNLSSWDLAGGAIILQQAGGRMTDFSGGNNYIFGKELMCSNNALAEEFFAIVGGYLAKTVSV